MQRHRREQVRRQEQPPRRLGKLCEGESERYSNGRNALQTVKKRYEEIDAVFNKYDAQVNATRLTKSKEGVLVLRFKEIKRRVERAFPRNCQEIQKRFVYTLNLIPKPNLAKSMSRKIRKGTFDCTYRFDEGRVSVESNNFPFQYFILYHMVYWFITVLKR